MRVEHLEDALGRRHRLLEVGVDAAQLLDRAVHHEQRGDERANSPVVERAPARSARLPYQSSADDRDAAEELHQRRQRRQRAGDLHVGAIEPVRRLAKPLASCSSAPNALTMRWPVNASAREVRQMLELLPGCAASCGARAGRAGPADRRRAARRSARPAPGASRSRTAARRSRPARAPRASGRRPSPRPPAAPGRRRW